MSELTPELATRLAKLIPRLASGHAGEVAATVAAIARTLQAGGCDLHDLAAHVAAPRVDAAGEPNLDGARSRRSRECSAVDEVHKRAIVRCVEQGFDLLSEWEFGFLESLAEQLVKGRSLSAKQVGVLDGIAAKVLRAA